MWNSSSKVFVFFVLVVLSLVGMLINHYPHNTHQVQMHLIPNAQCLHLVDRHEIPSRKWNTVIDNRFTSVLRKLDLPLNTYIRILRNSVSMVDVPCKHTPTAYHANQACNEYTKASYNDHQHSLETRFPRTLRQMHAAGLRYNQPELQFLWQNGSSGVSEPLFYYLQSFQYYVVFCSRDKQGQESWQKGTQYIQEISSYMVEHSADFRRNKGLDFLVAASHPLNGNGPWGKKTYQISAYQRQTFLRTDFDYTGSNPKDIIVPYYIPRRSYHKVATNSSDSRDAAHLRAASSTPSVATSVESMPGGTTHAPVQKLLLYFSGGKNPPGGLREELEVQIARLQREDNAAARDVYFTTDREPYSMYESALEHSAFCAHVRGDTASSSRLFQIIEAGCIPVVISDWLMLPFERVIDYSKFTLRFPESVVHDVGAMIAHLRSLPSKRVQEMQEAAKVAKELLLFPPSPHGGAPVPAEAEFHLLNPVTLALVEMVMRRKEYCDTLTNSPTHPEHGSETTLPAPSIPDTSTLHSSRGDMCTKLYARLQVAGGH